MKKIPSFLVGVLVTLLIVSLTIPALAAAGITITVNSDMKVKVNGEVFQPKDVNGQDVMIFEYNGTTYAPLRAVAESYGLYVGYDQASRMATISKDKPADPTPPTTEPTDDAGYEAFKAMWCIEKTSETTDVDMGDTLCYVYKPSLNYDSISEQEFHSALEKIGETKINQFIKEWLTEKKDGEHSIYFDFGSFGWGHGSSRYINSSNYTSGAFTIHNPQCKCDS